MKYFSFLFLLCGLLFSCNSEKVTEKKAPAKDTAAAPAPPTSYYPFLPLEEGQMLARKVDYIDYLFYQLPVSMSFHDPASVRSALTYVGNQPAPKDSNCKSIGRVSFQSDGEIIMEAEMHFSNGCAHYVFLKDNKPTYGNRMSAGGVKFFTDLINRTKTVPAQ